MIINQPPKTILTSLSYQMTGGVFGVDKSLDVNAKGDSVAIDRFTNNGSVFRTGRIDAQDGAALTSKLGALAASGIAANRTDFEEPSDAASYRLSFALNGGRPVTYTRNSGPDTPGEALLWATFKAVQSLQEASQPK